MLVKVRLPAAMPQMPPLRMSMPPLPVSMSDVDLTLSSFPSSSTILLSLLAMFILTSFVRALWVGLQEHLALVHLKKHQQKNPTPAQSLVQPQQEKSVASSQSQPIQPTTTSGHSEPAVSSWLWGLVRWERHPATAASVPPSEDFTANEKQAWPQYEPRRPPTMMMSQVGRRTGPAFARPLPTLYESDIPVSMAKMIMSRHTFRRPTSRPPPARSANTVQIQRKMPALQMPSSPSSLSRQPSPPSRSPSPPSPSSSRRSTSPPSSRSPSPPQIPATTASENCASIV